MEPVHRHHQWEVEVHLLGREPQGPEELLHRQVVRVVPQRVRDLESEVEEGHECVEPGEEEAREEQRKDEL